MSETVPTWLRALDVIIGFIMVILGIWVIWGLIDSAILIGLWVMQILGIILIIWGIWTIIKIFLYKEATMGYKVLLLIAGLLLLIFGGLTFSAPLLTQDIISILAAVGILIYGVFILIAGFMGGEAAGWQRWLGVILGFFLIIIGAYFLFNWFAAAAFLYFLLAIALLFAGFVRIVFGLSGEYY